MFGILAGFQDINKLNEFKKERLSTYLGKMNLFAEKQIKRLDHWYKWNGRAKASAIKSALNKLNQDIQVTNTNISENVATLFSEMSRHRYGFDCINKSPAFSAEKFSDKFSKQIYKY